MPNASDIAIFLIASLLLNITPGPDMLYVVARSMEQGWRAGIVSALGIGAGIFVHIFAVAAGLSTLLVSLPLGYEVVKYVGALYLIYLGVRVILSKETPLGTSEAGRAGLWAVFRQGVITNVLNPKVALFFLAFLPQFVDESRGPVPVQVIFLGILFNFSGTLVNMGVAWVSGSVGNKLKGRPSFSRAQRWLTGGVFIALAVRLVLLDKKS